ncbi:MAG: hypothetical protein IPK13_15075 [Deltaproteobacteria bacterium]|nr:hypothetical protein [Deltaproteobacteria bacterium]
MVVALRWAYPTYLAASAPASASLVEHSTEESASRGGAAIEFSGLRRIPIPLVFYAPTKRLAVPINRNRVAGFIDDLLLEHTDLRVVLVDDQTVDDCIDNPSPPTKGRMTCLVEAARADYVPYDRAGKLQDWARAIRVHPTSGIAAHDRAALERAPPAQRGNGEADKPDDVERRFMIVVAMVRLSEQEDRLVTFLVDTDHALEHGIHAARLRGAYGGAHMEALEAYIVEHAVMAQSDPALVGSEADVQAAFRRFFAEDHRLVEVFRRARHWWAFGRAEFSTDVEGVNILLDHRPVGLTLRGLNRLTRLVPGSHRLQFEHPDFVPLTMVIEVESDRTTSVAIALARRPNVEAQIGRQATLWGGLALTVGGTAFALWQLARTPSTRVLCLHGAQGDSSCGGSAEFLRAGQPANPGPVDDPNGSGIMLAPFGLGVASGGLAMASGTLLLGDDTEFPWVQIASGVTVGVATYLLSALLNGQNAIDASYRARP